jgi:hypothetical protein
MILQATALIVCLQCASFAQTGPSADSSNASSNAPVAVNPGDPQPNPGAQSGPNADSSAGSSADSNDAPDPQATPASQTPPSGSTNPQPRVIAGTNATNTGIPLTPGVSTTPLPYRPGDVLAATGQASLSEQFMAKLPKWMRFDGELRDRVEGYENASFKPNNSDLYDLYRLQLGLYLIPTSWIRFYIETSDDRVFERSPKIPPYEDTFDIRNAYVELGGTEANGFGLRVGRQDLYFGNGRLIGNSWWSNVSRSFDGVRGSYQNSDYRLDAFIASVVIERNGVVSHHNEGNNLSGLYGTIKNKVAPRSQLEPYVFWHVQQGATLKSGALGHLDEWTYGARFLGGLPWNFDYRTEMAIQRGELGPSSIKAWMGHWTVGNTLPVWLQVRPFFEFNYASGDPNSKNLSTEQTFDPIYPSTHDKVGLADQVGWRNMQDLRFGIDTHPTKKWATNVDWHDLWLANAHDSLYPTRGSVVAKDPAGTDGTHIGEEVDFQAVYKPTLQTQFGAGIGDLICGRFLKDTTKGKDYIYPYLLADWVF